MLLPSYGQINYQIPIKPRNGSSENLSFVASKLCSIRKRKDSSVKTFGRKSHCFYLVEIGYEIPFDSVPSQYLYASNNKSMSDIYSLHGQKPGIRSP